MTKQVKILVIAMCISAPFFLSADQPDFDQGPEQTEVYRTLNYYFYGVGMYDLDALKKAYHPNANFSFVDSKTGQLEQLDANEYFTMIEQSDHVYHERTLKVKSMDITGNAALVKAEIIYGKKGQRINDYLSLLKLDGAWRIVNRTSFREYATFGMEKSRNASEETLYSIESVVNTFLKGVDQVDLNAFEVSLHPSASVAYVNAKNGDFQKMSRPEYMVMYAGLTDQDLARRHEILQIDATGDMATVKIKTYYKRFKAATTDYIVLTKSNNEWQIVHKITHKDKKAYLAPA